MAKKEKRSSGNGIRIFVFCLVILVVVLKVGIFNNMKTLLNLLFEQFIEIVTTGSGVSLYNEALKPGIPFRLRNRALETLLGLDEHFID